MHPFPPQNLDQTVPLLSKYRFLHSILRLAHPHDPHSQLQIPSFLLAYLLARLYLRLHPLTLLAAQPTLLLHLLKFLISQLSLLPHPLKFLIAQSSLHWYSQKNSICLRYPRDSLAFCICSFLEMPLPIMHSQTY